MLLLSAAKGVTTPGMKDGGQNDRGMHDELLYEAGKHAQATAGLAQYIDLDCPDMAYAVKTALQSMTKPDKLMLLRVCSRWYVSSTAPEACLVLRIPGVDNDSTLLW